MKILIDANVILRYLLNDDPVSADKAKEIIDKGAFTVSEVIAEVVYVLKGVYNVSRKDIADTLTDFLFEIEIENKSVLLKAFSIYSESSLDFVDCILIAYHEVIGVEVFSFDKKLNKMIQSYDDRSA